MIFHSRLLEKHLENDRLSGYRLIVSALISMSRITNEIHAKTYSATNGAVCLIEPLIIK